MGANLLKAQYGGISVVPLRWKDDFEFMVRAVHLDHQCLHYASDRLKSVPEFIKATAQLD